MRNETLDDLKLVLAIMVAGIHSNFLGEYFPEVSHFLVDYLFRIAVPVFFMINGFFAADIIADGQRFGRWCRHIVLMFLVWNCIYVADIVGGLTSVEGVFSAVFVGFYHLWYLPALLGAGVVLYLLRRAPWPVIAAVVVVCYAVGLGLQYAGNYHLFKDARIDGLLQHYPVYRNFLFMGAPLFGLGVLAARLDLAARIPRPAVWCGLTAGLVCLVAEYAINRLFGVREGIDLLVVAPVLASALFLWALQSQRRSNSSDMSDTASLIFFLHPLVLKGLQMANVPLGGSFKLVVVVFIIAVAAPYLKRLNAVLKHRLKVSAI